MNYIYNISNHPKRSEIEKRLEIIKFFDKFGQEATKQAFNKGRSTIFLWKQKIKQSGGKLSSLSPASKAPRTRAKRVQTEETIQFIKNYRLIHPGSDKVTIKPLLDNYCTKIGITTLSESTIGRVIRTLKDKGQIPDYYIRTTINGKTGKLLFRKIGKHKIKKMRSKGYCPKNPGDLVQIDAISFFKNGIKRYCLCALDVTSRFAFAYLYNTLSSTSAKNFVERLEEVAPFGIRAIQTDNGSEFHKYFDKYLKERNIIHYWNYPKYPKGNAFIERFNGVIQRQYIGWHIGEIDDTDTFNKGLMQYLIWYNTEKVHRGIGKQPPLRYIINTFMSSQKSNMLWTVTKIGFFHLYDKIKVFECFMLLDRGVII